eukprot:CAMPEP_0174257068 /NCGR_PEP_ID=MMETSP0439-20130205/6241_1 /TAXON_ID=0 /ORGANISM="Stereomyxa ramosa, Strain Chinc5" /LENGTH=506 /DNA_ID=CAMNT_0015339979 /DNA_START=151 /DNA_END=1667 /DNA_ORIENTATION=+
MPKKESENDEHVNYIKEVKKKEKKIKTLMGEDAQNGLIEERKKKKPEQRNQSSESAENGLTTTTKEKNEFTTNIEDKTLEEGGEEIEQSEEKENKAKDKIENEVDENSLQKEDKRAEEKKEEDYGNDQSIENGSQSKSQKDEAEISHSIVNTEKDLSEPSTPEEDNVPKTKPKGIPTTQEATNKTTTNKRNTKKLKKKRSLERQIFKKRRESRSLQTRRLTRQASSANSLQRNLQKHMLRKHFPELADKVLFESFPCALDQESLEIRGRMYVCEETIAFFSNISGEIIKVVHPIENISEMLPKKSKSGDSVVVEIKCDGDVYTYSCFGDVMHSFESMIISWNCDKAPLYLNKASSLLAEFEEKELEKSKKRNLMDEDEEVKKLEEEIARLERAYHDLHNTQSTESSDYSSSDSDFSDSDEFSSSSDEEDQEYEMIVRVKHVYDAEMPNELDLHEGELIGVLRQHDSGWWKGQNSDGETGLFPITYCEICSIPSSVGEDDSSPINKR